MRVKIKDTLYSIEDGPICIELTYQDKVRIKAMPFDCTKYAVFNEDYRTKKERIEWMKS